MKSVPENIYLKMLSTSFLSTVSHSILNSLQRVSAAAAAQGSANHRGGCQVPLASTGNLLLTQWAPSAAKNIKYIFKKILLSGVIVLSRGWYLLHYESKCGFKKIFCWKLVQFSCSVILISLQSHGLQLRIPCPPPTPRACSNSWQLSWWCHSTISSSVVLFSSCLQFFPASGSFPASQFFASGGRNIGASVSSSVLPMNIQDCFL